RHRQAGLAEAEDEHRGVFEEFHQRSFRLARPIRQSSIVTIQNRTTTWVSFQPDFSKWWCSGAILKKRRPSPYFLRVYLNQPTCTITDKASTTKMPPMMASTISWRTMTAMVPSAPPSASAP